MTQDSRWTLAPSLPRACVVVGVCVICVACTTNAPAPVAQVRPQVRPQAGAPARAAAPVTPAAMSVTPVVVEAGAAAASGGAGYYTVKKGDTLHGIALDQGLYYRDLAAWNGIENVDRIFVGQQLRLAPPDAAQVASTQPVIAPGQVEARPLDAGAVPPAAAAVTAVAPPPASADSERLKREPKGGKEPYSEAALARLRQADALLFTSMAPEPRTAPAPSAKPQSAAAATGAANAPGAPGASSVPGASSGPGAPSTPSAPPAAADEALEWTWPVSGKLIAPFAEGSNKGIDIAAKTGDPVLAAAAGKVVYAGSGLRGYGKLVIVKHNPVFLSAYAHNSQILVKEGQSVARGQKIAEAGSSDSEQPQLHFEIRRQGKPVDPLKHLPGRAP